MWDIGCLFLLREPGEHLMEVIRARRTSPEAFDEGFKRAGIVELAALTAARGVDHRVHGSLTSTLRRQGEGRSWTQCHGSPAAEIKC